jgi:hypothetical protein
MPGIRIRQEPVQLHFESTKQVVVVADNEDRFVTTSAEAARACKQAQDSVEWNRQWSEFLFHIHEWCKRHDAKVEAGFVTVGDSALNVLICIRGETYDFDLEDELADFDLELCKRFPVCRAEVLQIPNQGEVKTGLSGEAILVYGDGQRASEASKA